MLGRTGKLSFLCSRAYDNVHFPSASMLGAIHAGQDNNVHAPSASMIESIHAGQDDNVHGPSASMFEASVLAKITTFMFIAYPCS